jgi:hypothetical protein
MKPEQQRIAIAEACGWRIESDGTSTFIYRPNEKVGNGYRLNNIRDPKIIKLLPDYLNDLNAMHEAVISINCMIGKRAKHREELCRVVNGRNFKGDLNTEHEWRMEHATAAQRAEAFLRTINKWEDAP